VEESLRTALGQTQGNLRIGIINTIGDRKDRASLNAVSALVSGQDEATARAALNAIGKIGGAPAVEALDGAKVPASLKAVWGDAYLRCAGSVEPARAQKMYRALFEGEQALLGIPGRNARFQTVQILLREIHHRSHRRQRPHPAELRGPSTIG